MAPKRLPIQPSDRELISACTTGQSWAWHALIDRYKRLVYALPLRAGLSHEDAADVFQTVFTRLLEHLHTLEDPQRLAKWLIVTTKRESWSLCRRKGREAVDDEAVFGLLQASSGSVHEDRQGEEAHLDGTLVREALEQLGEPCRNLLEQLYFDPQEPSYEEISRRLCIPLGSIGPTRARCLQKLRNILRGMGLT